MNDFERTLLASPALPSLPSVSRRVLELFQRDAELTELASLLETEPALYGRVMQLVNSGLYRLSRQAASLREVVLYLGLGTVRSIALSFSLLSTFPRRGRGERPLELLWRIALMRAITARELAAKVGGWEPEEAFLTGLMSSSGALLLFQSVPGYRELVERFERGEGELIELEPAELETDHGRMAVLLLERWGFAPRLLDPIRASFGMLDPAAESEELRRRGRLLRAADLAARCLLVEGFQDQARWLPRRLSHLSGLAEDVLTGIVERLPARFHETARLFEIPHERQIDYEELRARAGRALEGEAVAAGRGTGVELERRSLQEALEVDEVTGTLSRESFERLLEALHRQARRTRRPIGLLVLGIENWKALESAAGEPQARQILAEVAHTVTSLIRRSDPSARLSEHQLAVLAPGCAPKDLPVVAERIRLGLESAPLGGSLGLELAIGGASTHPHHDAADASGLLRCALREADRAAQSAERIAFA